MMRVLRRVAVFFAVAGTLPLACGTDDSGRSLGSEGGAAGEDGRIGDGGEGGEAGGGGPPRTIGEGCNGDSADSEGSESSPVVVSHSGLPYLGGLSYRDGPSYYRVTGLDVAARYTVSMAGPILAQASIFQEGFAGIPICEVGWYRADSCFAVPQQGSLDIVVEPINTDDDGECFTLDVAFDSPAGAFEGATDNLMTLRYGTPDLPHRGIVDHERSYYRISQLDPGTLYTLYMTGRNEQVHLIVGEEDPEGGVVNSPCLTGETMVRDVGEPSCMFEAEDESIGVSVWHYGSIDSSKYVLSVFEELTSEGSIGAPIVLPYNGGLEYDGRVGPRIEADDWQFSYYEITGLSPQTAYLVGLTDAAGINVLAFSDAGFQTPVACTNFDPKQGCEVTSPGTSLYLRVASYTVHSRRFVLNVHEEPIDEGEYSAPLALDYPGDFPYSGQSSWTSEYTIAGLPAGLLLVSLQRTDGPVSFSAWAADKTTLDCSSGARFPRCTLSASAQGEMRLRATGPGHFELAIDAAPLLASDFTRDTEPLVIPNADPDGVTDELEVDGSPITSIEAVTVELFVRHGIPAELEAFLIAPDGTEVQVSGKDGGPYEGVFFNDYELEELSGLWRDAAFSSRPATPLHSLEGLDANGTWTLRLVDDENPNIQGNAGELYGWGLSFR